MRSRAAPGSSSKAKSNGLCRCTCTGPPPQGMDISELEFVQIIIILLVMTFMTVVIICLLNHYRLSALAFLSRLSHAQRDRDAQRDANGVWSNGVLTQQRNGEATCGHLNRTLPPFVQQQLCRFQPTYPLLPQEIINLPPIICLSDGEELPYKGPCNLQLRHPDQQLELCRASVRAPPNRTVFKSDFIDIYIHSTRPSVLRSDRGNGRPEHPPPSYGAVMGVRSDAATNHSPASNNAPPAEARPRHGGSEPASADTDQRS